ncbi:hypothetical protein [Roseofilum casamattae]|uniref:Secreted protein n=1 Tax=Roseofilum casamattae BLCC-M143 TaxID=3022442 RepID=A0ABT7C2V7_9CYAN|nr:hypothetical protein [Roseofilum casamattae]MDJ1185787.1 hypothetical protein [Roseofilum casamattae BLCC-M143]
MRTKSSVKVNQLVFLSLLLGTIGWTNLQANATVTSGLTQSTQTERRGSGRRDPQKCSSAQSFDGSEVVRRGSGRRDAEPIS